MSFIRTIQNKLIAFDHAYGSNKQKNYEKLKGAINNNKFKI